MSHKHGKPCPILVHPYINYPLSLDRFPPNLSYQMLQRTYHLQNLSLFLGAWNLNLQPQCFFSHGTKILILFQIWAISFSKKPHGFRFAVIIHTHLVSTASLGLDLLINPQLGWGLWSVLYPGDLTDPPETKITPEKRPCSSFQPSIFSKYIYIHMYNYVFYIYSILVSGSFFASLNTNKQITNRLRCIHLHPTLQPTSWVAA